MKKSKAQNEQKSMNSNAMKIFNQVIDKDFIVKMKELFLGNRFHGYADYRLKTFVKRVAKNIPKGESVLDAGAGECQYKKYLTHTDYVSQDLCIGDPDWDFSDIDIKSEIYDIPVKSKSFQHILCIEVLEHLMYPHKAFTELSRILKPGGYLYVVCPLAWLEHQKPYDYFRYTQFALKRLGEDVGLEVVEMNKHGGKWAVFSTYFNGLIPTFFIERKMGTVGRLSQFIFYPINLVMGMIFFLLDKTDISKDLTGQYECVYKKL